MLALALAASLGATSVEDYNAVRQNGNNAALGVLGAWGLASAVTGAVGWATVTDQEWQGVHLANLAWGLGNLAFAVAGLYLGLRPGATRTERADALADGVSTQNVYAINVAFEVGYLAIAALVVMHFKNARVVGFAKGSLVQGLALLAFDAALALFHQINNERIR